MSKSSKIFPSTQKTPEIQETPELLAQRLAIRKAFIELQLRFLEAIYQLGPGPASIKYDFSHTIFANIKQMISSKNLTNKDLNNVSDILRIIGQELLVKNPAYIELQEYEGIVEQNSPRSKDTIDVATRKLNDFRAMLTSIIQPVRSSLALLDVDCTLIIGSESKPENFNKNLVEALKAKGITDVFLFSRMNISLKGLKDRGILIDWLRQNGLNVLGVITDTDPGARISIPEKAEYIRIAMRPDPTSAEEAQARKEQLAAAKERLNTQLSVFANAYENKPFDLGYGTPFREADTAFANGTFVENKAKTGIEGGITTELSTLRDYGTSEPSQPRRERSANTAAASSQQQQARNTGGSKGVMYEAVMCDIVARKLPYNTVFVVDDDKTSLEAVKQAHERFFVHRGVHLVTIDNASKQMEQRQTYEDRLDGLTVNPVNTQATPQSRPAV